MSELPKGWVEAELDNLGVWKGGGTPSKGNRSFWIGNIPWVSPKDMKAIEIFDTLDHISREAVENSTTNLVPEDSILVVNRSGILAHSFPVAIARKEVSLNQDLKALIPNPAILPVFIRDLLRARAQDILNTCRKTGTTVASVEFDKLKAYKVGLPPANEQKRIVKKLEACEERINTAREALDEVPSLLDQYRQSVLAAAFRGDLTKKWRQQNPDVEPASELLSRLRQERRQKWEEAELAKYQAKDKTPPKNWKERYKEPNQAEIPAEQSIPPNWTWVTLEQISTAITDGVHKKPKYVSEGIPFVTVKNLTAGKGISFENLNYVTHEDHVEFSKRTKPERDDILVSKDGTLGVIRRIETDIEFSIFVSVALIKPISRFLGPYLEWALNSRFSQSEMKATGSGLQHIHLVDLRKVRVPFPPKEEQIQIAKTVSTLIDRIETLETYQAESVLDLNKTKESILERAFRGDLVPQDPDDEPAIKLLERIEEQRAKAPKKKRTTKRTAKTTRMQKLTPELIKAKIESLPDKSFDFSDLRNVLPGNYDDISSMVIQLLSESNPVVKQVFDKEQKTMRFERTA
ncbi:restriction endonuclease subunit S [Pelagicoccus mobilis]|uniref:Restriction endonuclease subunit S n=1 Tax=Pelagicoccus mobilis TaxID=415221 RepID=A0A934VRU3_9BACT|nr:restriction endonuclease subunit S [Pelagicoccus mobilis]MBK1877973.1 restriction endonuclease subunit S [Pelagicoccus mobilis]